MNIYLPSAYGVISCMLQNFEQKENLHNLKF